MAFLFSTCRTNFDRRTGRNFMIVLVLQHSRSITISAITSNFAGQNNIDKKKKRKQKILDPPPLRGRDTRWKRDEERGPSPLSFIDSSIWKNSWNFVSDTCSYILPVHPPSPNSWKNRRGRRPSPFLSPKTTNVNLSSRFVASLFYRETRIRLLTASSHFSSREIWRAKLWWDCCGRDEKVDRGAILLSTRHQR